MRDSDVLKTIELSHPIPVPVAGKDGETVEINILKLGRFKGKHLKHIPPSIMEAVRSGGKKKAKIIPEEFIPFVAAVAELPIESIEEMDVADIMKAAVELADVLGE